MRMADALDNVATPSTTHVEMESRTELIKALWGGTPAMRKAAQRWLPQNQKETARAYSNRLEMTVLFDAFRDTVGSVVDGPFARDVRLVNSERLDPRVAAIENDVDLQGAGLTSFCREAFRDAVLNGMTNILVDFPAVAPGLSATAENKLRVRPYFVIVSSCDLLEAMPVRGPNGITTVKRVRIKSKQLEPKGNWGDQLVEYVKVITFSIPGVPDSMGSWEQWRKNPETGEWALQSEGPFPFQGVPMVTLYLERDGFMLARPPLDSLAWQCLRHWQSTSDQNLILHVARFAQLFCKGISKEELGSGQVEVGPLRAIHTMNAMADAKYLDPGGAALDAGFKDLQTIEDRQQSLGSEPFQRQTGTVVATARAITEAREKSAIQSWVRGTEIAVRSAFEIAQRWYGLDLDEKFQVDVYNEFSLGTRARDDLAVLDGLHARGGLTDKTYLRELQRRDTLAADVDIEAEVREVAKQKESMMRAFSGVGMDDEDDDGDAGPGMLNGQRQRAST
jgi:hypothetical protein